MCEAFKARSGEWRKGEGKGAWVPRDSCRQQIRAEAATALTDAGHIQTPDGSRTPTGCTPPLTKCLGQPLWLPRSEGASARRERAHT